MHDILRTIALGLALGVGITSPAVAQNTQVPFVENAWEYGRRSDDARLRLCVDTRDGAWAVEREIGEAIAGALLLEPVVHQVESQREVQELDDVYGVMLEHCAVHMGFRVSGAYPRWLTPTRPYYSAAFVFVTSNPEWRSLGDVPFSEPIASTLGTQADLRLVSYLLALPADRRWSRFPAGSSAQTLAALLNGTVEVALVWEPALWAARRADPAYAALRAIDPDPLPETRESVGAVALGAETFLRAGVDEAIAALSADGGIAAILERHDFPGDVAP